MYLWKYKKSQDSRRNSKEVEIVLIRPVNSKTAHVYWLACVMDLWRKSTCYKHKLRL
jgi:hypothetical protein